MARTPQPPGGPPPRRPRHRHPDEGTADAPLWHCWSCGELIDGRDGIDLRGNPEGAGGGPGSPGTVDVQCCLACWETIPPWGRLLVGLAFRSTVAGGVGINDLAKTARAAVDEFRRWVASQEGEGPAEFPWGDDSED